jgi:hypothetical protein
MPTYADDALAGLFAPDDSGRAVTPFSVGTLTSLSVDGTNTVTADGVTYQDLPTLFESDGYGTLPTRVLLAKTPGGLIVLGRLIIPGVP